MSEIDSDFIYNGKGIEIEMDGGSGTVGVHWDESLFDGELMTGYVDSHNHLSEMTLASLKDLGYDVHIDHDTLWS
jgi:hypothetical protein